MNRGTVLVVEDDAALREVICDTLQLAQYRVETAENGQQALQRLADNGDIALMLSDVQMQPVNGYELLKSARTRLPQLPVILMTAYGTIEKAVKAMHDGASDYLVKPFEADTLVNMVARFIVPRGVKEDDGFIAVDPRSRETAEVARRVAGSDATVPRAGSVCRYQLCGHP